MVPLATLVRLEPELLPELPPEPPPELLPEPPPELLPEPPPELPPDELPPEPPLDDEAVPSDVPPSLGPRLVGLEPPQLAEMARATDAETSAKRRWFIGEPYAIPARIFLPLVVIAQS